MIMNNILEFLKSRKIWYWLALAATVLSIVTLIVYLLTGRTQFDPNYSNRAIIGLTVTVVLGVISLVKTYRYVLFAQFVFGLFGFINYITSQLNLLGNILYNVDGSSIPSSLVIGIGFALIATVLALVSAILMRPAKKAEEA